MNISQKIAEQLMLSSESVDASIQLFDAGNTIPFIARYRKEATGDMDEDQLRLVNDLLGRYRALEKRRQTILDSIESQNQLTPQLEAQLQAADTLTVLEDLYQPYKPKRRTRAIIAREKNLQELADIILAQERSNIGAEEIALRFLNDQVSSVDEALSGARDIVAETINDNATVRNQLRQKGLRWATLITKKIEESEDPRQVYRLYYDFSARVDHLRPHQVLAINRGEDEKILRVKIDIPERDWRQSITSQFGSNIRSPFRDQLELAADDAAKRLLLPAIERDIRRDMTTRAESHAILVFAVNLKNLLLQPPLTGQVVLGIDPGFRTGSKIAVIDQTGRVLKTETIYPHPPQNMRTKALTLLKEIIRKHNVSLIAIGNGTASRETEGLVAEMIGEPQDQDDSPEDLHYLIINEAGASVYSASPLARDELPDLDVTLRGAVSIARRVQDPLAELVKIDARSLGIGMYQHDVNQQDLISALDGVVESVVNQVGVDVNTASVALLTHVAGIGPKLAENIIEYRNAHGPFTDRESLLEVTGLGPKSFEQAAGFLRIRDGTNPFDSSAIHPESYYLAHQILQLANISLDTPPSEREQALNQWMDSHNLQSLANRLQAGVPTIRDILEQLVKPGRDPRDDLPPPILRSDVLTLEDLSIGMIMKGTVRNVVDFGAFIDIGLKNDGLLHRSQWPRSASLAVGDIVEVTILSIEPDRGRISFGWYES